MCYWWLYNNFGPNEVKRSKVQGHNQTKQSKNGRSMYTWTAPHRVPSRLFVFKPASVTTFKYIRIYTHIIFFFRKVIFTFGTEATECCVLCAAFFISNTDESRCVKLVYASLLGVMSKKQICCGNISGFGLCLSYVCSSDINSRLV